MCEACGGSGVLGIVSSREDDDGWVDAEYLAACHLCPMGLVMMEAGVPA